MKYIFLFCLILIIIFVFDKSFYSPNWQNEVYSNVSFISPDSLYKTQNERKVFINFKEYFIRNVYDSSNCYLEAYIKRNSLPKKTYWEYIDSGIDNIFWNLEKDTVCFIFTILRKQTDSDDGALSGDTSTESILMLTTFDSTLKKCIFHCGKAGYGSLVTSGNEITNLSKQYRMLLLREGFFLDGTRKRDPSFFKRVFNGESLKREYNWWHKIKSIVPDGGPVK